MPGTACDTLLVMSSSINVIQHGRVPIKSMLGILQRQKFCFLVTGCRVIQSKLRQTILTAWNPLQEKMLVMLSPLSKIVSTFKACSTTRLSGMHSLCPKTQGTSSPHSGQKLSSVQNYFKVQVSKCQNRHSENFFLLKESSKPLELVFVCFRLIYSTSFVNFCTRVATAVTDGHSGEK